MTIKGTPKLGEPAILYCFKHFNYIFYLTLYTVVTDVSIFCHCISTWLEKKQVFASWIWLLDFIRLLDSKVSRSQSWHTLANLQLGYCGTDLRKNSSGRIGVLASATQRLKNIFSLSLSPLPLFFPPPFLSLNLLSDREQRGRSGMKNESKAKEKASAQIPALSWMPVSRTYSISILNIAFRFAYK